MDHIVCRECNTKLRFSGNTTTGRDHLRAKHNIIATTPATSQQPTVKSRFTVTPSPPTQEERTQDCLTMIYTMGLPLSFTEHPGFKMFATKNIPDFIPPSRSTVTRRLQARYQIAVADTKARIAEQPPGYVHACTDGWTSDANVSFSILTVGYLTEELQMCNDVLSVKEVSGGDGEAIAADLNAALNDFNIIRVEDF